MTKYILKRIALLMITMIIALTITFFLLRFVNKPPAALEELINKTMASPKNKEPLSVVQANVYSKYGYNDNMNAFEAFWEYIKDIFHGDFGKNYSKLVTGDKNTILQQFVSPLRWTILIAGLGFVFGTLLGISFGIIAGYKRGKTPDIMLNLFAIAFVAVPSFVIAAFAANIAYKNNWPITFSNPNNSLLIETFKSLVIPISIVTVTSFATITYYIRNEVVEVLKSDYVATARSKGLSERKIFMKHVARNVSIPAVTIILPRFILIIMGSFVIEKFFSVPGTATMFSTAAVRREYDVIMFSVMFFTTLSLLISLLLDVIYVLIDPRIKIAKNNKMSFIDKAKMARVRAEGGSK